MKLLHFLLKFFSQRILKKYSPEVIGITGSVGKTSAKDFIYTVLAGSFSVRKSEKNYNNQIGTPLTIIGIHKSPGRSMLGWAGVFLRALKLLVHKDPAYPKILVLEMGADRPGDISYLTTLAPCTVGVLTAIAHAHTEFFGSVKKIAQEKRVIISHLPKNGTAILNADYQLVLDQTPYTKAPIMTYGFKDGADVRVSDVGITIDEKTGWPSGLRFKVSHGGSIVPVFLPGVVAEPFVSAAAAAIAVGVHYGVHLVQAAERLTTINPIPGHLSLIAGIKNTMLIDDTYNSSPDAVRAALKLLAAITPSHSAERFAVLGDMLELGDETQQLHREIGFLVAELGIDNLITVGEASKHTALGAKEAGMDEHRIASFSMSPEAGRFLQEKLSEGAVALIKGSQGSRMEKIVKEVMAEPEKAAELLVRQTPEWIARS